LEAYADCLALDEECYKQKLQADSCVASSKVEEATDLYYKALSNRATSVPVHINLSTLEFKKNNYGVCRKLCRGGSAILTSGPSNAPLLPVWMFPIQVGDNAAQRCLAVQVRLLVKQATAAVAIGDTADAKACLKKAATIAPDDESIRRDLAKLEA
jgi:tetratricopeptide (TPR) repeat protein